MEEDLQDKQPPVLTPAQFLVSYVTSCKSLTFLGLSFLIYEMRMSTPTTSSSRWGMILLDCLENRDIFFYPNMRHDLPNNLIVKTWPIRVPFCNHLLSLRVFIATVVLNPFPNHSPRFYAAWAC